VAVDDLIGGLSRLDIVVSAAGVIRRDEEHDPNIFADVLAINLTGAMRVCTAAKPKLVEAGGAVVNLASMLTFFGGPRVPAYSASKGGIGQLTKSLAAAWAEEGVRVNAVAPGWIATPPSHKRCGTTPSAAGQSCSGRHWRVGEPRRRLPGESCFWDLPLPDS
jgi:NAD(P)-dependent dehydrogenase (short-subunit alcohol dehydrogenase family)